MNTVKPDDQKTAAIGWMDFAHSSLTESHREPRRPTWGRTRVSGSIRGKLSKSLPSGSFRKRQTRQGLLHRISSIEDLPRALGHRGCFWMTWSWSDEGNLELFMIRNVRVVC